MEVDYYSSRLFESFEWVAKMTGTFVNSVSYKPVGQPVTARSSDIDAVWFDKIGVTLSNQIMHN